MTEADLTIEEAARRCGVSTETIRRRLRSDGLPGAYRAGRGKRWQIPAAALVNAGFDLNRSKSPSSSPESGAGDIAAERLNQIRLLERQVEQLSRIIDTLTALLHGQAAK